MSLSFGINFISSIIPRQSIGSDIRNSINDSNNRIACAIIGIKYQDGIFAIHPQHNYSILNKKIDYLSNKGTSAFSSERENVYVIKNIIGYIIYTYIINEGVYEVDDKVGYKGDLN